MLDNASQGDPIYSKWVCFRILSIKSLQGHASTIKKFTEYDVQETSPCRHLDKRQIAAKLAKNSVLLLGVE
jgi:hypothetical protein